MTNILLGILNLRGERNSHWYLFVCYFKIRREILFRSMWLEGWTAIGIRCTRLWNSVELFCNSLDNAPSSIVFYLKMKVEVGVHNIKSRFTPRMEGSPEINMRLLPIRVLIKLKILMMNVKQSKPRGEPRPNIVYTYFHFHFQVEDNRWRGII